MNFNIPESLKIISSKISINSTGKLVNFSQSQLGGCTDGGNISIPSKYNGDGSEIDGDFLLFIGSMNDTVSGTLAYATFCVLGNFLLLLAS